MLAIPVLLKPGLGVLTSAPTPDWTGLWTACWLRSTSTRTAWVLLVSSSTAFCLAGACRNMICRCLACPWWANGGRNLIVLMVLALEENLLTFVMLCSPRGVGRIWESLLLLMFKLTSVAGRSLSKSLIWRRHSFGLLQAPCLGASHSFRLLALAGPRAAPRMTLSVLAKPATCS